mmetsp:Transcript_123479/g.349699  ORF Transcript_123479/g.349699 Transcript_123479/m.349699 type:complete len:200 (+) Transcript_123479:17-616(+)
MLAAAIFQPAAVPHPANAAPMKTPSHRLWTKSPRRTAARTRMRPEAPPAGPASESSGVSFPFSAGGRMGAMQRSMTLGIRKPAKMEMPQDAASRASSLLATRCVASKRSRKKAAASRAPAAKALVMVPKTPGCSLARRPATGTRKTTPTSVQRHTSTDAPIASPHGLLLDAGGAASSPWAPWSLSSAMGSTSCPETSFR